MTTENSFFRTGPALAIKLASEMAERGIIEGYGSTFDGEPDVHGDIVERGAFAKTLARRYPVMLWSHDLKRPIGKWTEAKEDSRGLYLKGSLNLDTTAGREMHAHIKAGDISGLSIGFLTPSGGAHIDLKTGIRRLTEVDLFEVSPVTIPANMNARITAVKSFGSQRELQSHLHETGLSRGAAAKIAAAGWQALNGDENDTADINILAARLKSATAHIKNMKG